MRSDSLSRIEYYKRLIELRGRQPDIPIARFCSQNGISTWCYYTWRKRIAALNGKEYQHSGQSFVPVRIESLPVSTYSFEVLLPNGIVVRSGRQLDRDIVSVLAGIGGA